MEQLIQRHQVIVSRTTSTFHRYMYHLIDWRNRMIGLMGPRGVGKTTLILQHIKEALPGSKVLYVNAEDFYFSTHRLVDLADEMQKKGYSHLFIDEIHRYPDWAKELKLIYDYYESLQVVFSGSSILDLRKGASDLSRRAVMYNMQGMSFREYLELAHNIAVPVYSLSDMKAGGIDTSMIPHPLALFDEYLRRGYYPFMMELGYDEKLRQVIQQTLEVDIPSFASMNMSTGLKLKKLLSIIAESVPFKPNMKKIGEMIGVSRNDVANYISMIEEAGLVAQLRDGTGGIRRLGKVEKVYLDNTNIIYSLSPLHADIGNVRETFFYNQTRLLGEVTASRETDFTIGDASFEIGGRKKGQAQIETLDKGFVVKDDIEYGHDNVIPLWWFGLGY